MPSKYATATKKKTHKRKFYKFPKFWSYSRWKVWNECRARYEFQFLQKLEQPESPHMARGSYVHKLAEDYLDGGGRVPKELKEFADELKAIRKLGAKAEATLAFTKSWQETTFDDWANCWLRVKIDADITEADSATLIDFKTGKPWKDTKEQSELYAVAKMQREKKVENVDAEFWYTDSGEVVPYFYSRIRDFKKLKTKWQARAQEMLAARTFPFTKAAYNCKFCPFRSDKELGNGLPGPCEGWKKAK
jgi:RecB family exonuclease